MRTSILSLLTIISALGTGVMAGFFFAFSTTVMSALSRIPAEQGIAAMQSINVVVINRWVMGALFGTGAICLVLAVLSLMHWGEPGSALSFSGAVLYVLGTIAVTIAFNVPRNDALAAAGSTSVEAATLWRSYVPEWTRWNHLRTAAAFCAAFLLVIAATQSSAAR